MPPGTLVDEDPELEVLTAWRCPGPGDDPEHTRPKLYQVVKLDGGMRALRKSDTVLEYVSHEASVLAALAHVDCVPALLGQSRTSIYTRFICGRSLPEAFQSFGSTDCFRAAWQMLAAVARVHAGGVVHADIRPWNFIYGDDGRIYLFDFEYAYLRDEPRPDALLAVHHVSGLKTGLTDWTDVFRSLADLSRAASPRLVREGLWGAALGAYWALYLLRAPGWLWDRVRRAPR